MHQYLLGLLSALFLLSACGTKKLMTAEPMEIRQMDTLEVISEMPADLKSAKDFELPTYNAAAKRTHDLLHTKLDLRFDWEKEQVIGKATLTMKPFFYTADAVTLEAKDFVFNKVSLGENGPALQYTYEDDHHITVQLPRAYKRDEKFDLFFDYVATPAGKGGSDAITSDKGLFFINPRGEDPDKPTQIWTQGETESNSRWFPTFDKPNERTTQEIYVTVKDEYETLSNGTLVRSTKNADGTRTDYWKQDKPHAPYLFALIVGDFAVVEDTPWRGKPVQYYVEKEYEPYAKQIYPYTREMLELFSNQLGYEYPWDKYSQVVVRDYVSGAMENTSAVIFGDFMQKTARELIDVDQNEKIVAHELFHHWFGDLVTTENWANLTLNEGFANYSEYLWLEHKYGKATADFHRMNELSGYVRSSAGGIHPLIHYGYDDKEDMFDAHSYNKGGLVLHMLRDYVGDEAFFASLKRYLNDNQYTAVEVDELRMAFEDTTGEDLQWFFDQWFLAAGHPDLNVVSDYDPESGSVFLAVEQLQDPETQPAIFQLPIEVDIYLKNGEKMRKEIMMNKRAQEWSFKVPAEVALLDFDPDDELLAEIEYELTNEQELFRAANVSTFKGQFGALQALKGVEIAGKEEALAAALDHEFWVVRMLGLREIPMMGAYLTKVEQMARTDEHSEVRARAIGKLAETGDAKYVETARYLIDKDQAYNVNGAALQALVKLDNAAALTYAKRLESSESEDILNAVATMYAGSGDVQYRGFFENNWDKVGGFGVIDFMGQYAELLAGAPASNVLEATQKLRVIGLDMDASPWKRFGATKAINDLHSSVVERLGETPALASAQEALAAALTAIKAAETNNQLQNMYGNFPSVTP